MGKITADYFISDSGGKGNAVVEHVPSYPILNGFTEGFSKEVKAQCPACKTSETDITIPDLVAGKAPSTLVSALRSNLVRRTISSSTTVRSLMASRPRSRAPGSPRSRSSARQPIRPASPR